ncbi:MAG: thioesterase family protein [Burkholderiales bacterium]|nr:thioesterase family protein [Burkholderiales bacterium]
MNEFDESIALSPAGPREWSGRTDPRREAGTGMFGGWTSALLLKAVLGDAVDAGSPVSIAVHFLSPVLSGHALRLKTRPLGGGRALATWQAELHLEGAQAPAAIATVVLAKRRESFGFTDAVMPQTPPPDTLPTFHPPGTFGQRSLIRPVHGFPIFDRADARSVFWLRETSGRALDAILLAYLADNYPPRSWSRRTEPGPYSTVTLSAYFLATDAELAALGDDDVLLDVSCSRAESSTVAAQARIWSRGGVLLATTEQLGWFR